MPGWSFELAVDGFVLAGYGILPPNERMQLTWLIGAPSRPVSVHRRAIGRCGLGSSATQLMRAVRPLDPTDAVGVTGDFHTENLR